MASFCFRSRACPTCCCHVVETLPVAYVAITRHTAAVCYNKDGALVLCVQQQGRGILAQHGKGVGLLLCGKFKTRGGSVRDWLKLCFRTPGRP